MLGSNLTKFIKQIRMMKPSKYTSVYMSYVNGQRLAHSIQNYFYYIVFHLNIFYLIVENNMRSEQCVFSSALKFVK